MKLKHFIGILMLLCTVAIGGIFSAWDYLTPPAPAESGLSLSTGAFRFGMLYITEISGNASKTGDLTVNVTSDGAATLTLYNSTNVTYYYNTAETSGVECTVSNIAQGDSVAPSSYCTLSLSFSGAGDILLRFVIDPNDIEDVVANTALDRFADILNDPANYQTLEDGMNNRDGGWNKSSAVTYIGNVLGASNSDSEILGGLFGDDVMSMDLDGDGTVEPITMMIKREDLDSNAGTGDSYTYTSSSWGNTQENTVNGAEMTLYITAQSFDNVRNGDSIVVYAATFTKYSGESEWFELVSLTKGTADANNYNGSLWGDTNSFNTDTWRSDDGKTIEELVLAALS